MGLSHTRCGAGLCYPSKGWRRPISAYGPQGGKGTSAPLPDWPPSHGPLQPLPQWESTAGRGSPWAAWPWWQGDTVARWRSRLGWTHRPQHVTSAQEPPVSSGLVGDHSPGEGASGRRDTFCLLPPSPSAWYPTPGSPWGYLTPSLSSGFLRAGGRSTASHIPKETVGSFEKVGLTLGCLFIAPHALRSHASVPQRSCTGLFIFPLLCFPLGRPSQECWLVWQTWGS